MLTRFTWCKRFVVNFLNGSCTRTTWRGTMQTVHVTKLYVATNAHLISMQIVYLQVEWILLLSPFHTNSNFTGGTIYSGGSRILKRGVPVCTWLIAWSAQSAHARGGVARGGHVLPGKFLISDLLRSLLVLFGGETVRVGRPIANLGEYDWEALAPRKVWLGVIGS